MKVFVCASLLMALSACAMKQHPYMGINPDGTGYDGISKDRAWAECRFEARKYTGFDMLETYSNRGGVFRDCMAAKGFH